MSKEPMKLALEALEYIDLVDNDRDFLQPHECYMLDEAITALRQALANEALDKMAENARELGLDYEPAQQEPVSCPVCNQVHTILDADESQIIRNAKDGYPAGRTPRLLTLQERVTALCQYASDWKRWCLDSEYTPPPESKPLTDEEIAKEVEAELTHYWNGEYIDTTGARDQLTAFARAIEAAHGIKTGGAV